MYVCSGGRSKKMELDMDTRINAGCSAGVYMSAAKELIEKLQNAIAEAKTELEKYFNVSALLKHMPTQPPPPPQPQPQPQPQPVKNMIEEGNYGDEETLTVEKMLMYMEIDRIIGAMSTQQNEQVAKVHQMTNLANYLLVRCIKGYGFGYGYHKLLSIKSRYVARVDKAFETYKIQTAVPAPPPSTANQ
ncbi:hypothetical protein ABFS83_12G112300 [Erythranthe nasuta]